jgi:hypothetical protein
MEKFVGFLGVENVELRIFFLFVGAWERERYSTSHVHIHRWPNWRVMDELGVAKIRLSMRANPGTDRLAEIVRIVKQRHSMVG